MNIVFFCGPSSESWSPKSIDKGIGGSEEMVIYLARELAKKNKVIVYNRCSNEAGEYDGVAYENYEDFDPKDIDVLILWRMPNLLLKYELDKINCKKYLWLHDTINPLEVIPYLMAFDGILTLSDWHKNFYLNFTTQDFRKRFIQTSNAVDRTYLDQKVERDPYTIVYGSNYTRGLREFLEQWPKIKLAVPEAKLRIFYGWEYLEKAMKLDEFKKYKKEMEELMDQEGITHLGRISHKEVVKEMLGAGIWAYPCIQFNEVSCITAMRAQICGAIPVVIPRAALDETVKYGVKVREGNNAGEILDNWSNQLIRVLQDHKAQEALRKIMMKKSDFSFEKLAKEWEGLWS